MPQHNGDGGAVDNSLGYLKLNVFNSTSGSIPANNPLARRFFADNPHEDSLHIKRHVVVPLNDDRKSPYRRITAPLHPF